MNNKILIFSFSLLISLFSISYAQCQSQERLEKIISQYNEYEQNYIMVVSHRGDWKSYPENSLPAIQSVIDMGVDMVEIDVRKTKDEKFVLMHDIEVNRTTTGSGEVSKMTLKEIKQLKLLDKNGDPTDYNVPTLQEALKLAKGKIMINLDKIHQHIDEVYPILKETGTTNIAVFKHHYSKNELKQRYSDIAGKILYMPKINNKVDNVFDYIDNYESYINPSCYEINYSKGNSEVRESIKSVFFKGDNVWINSLGKLDKRAVDSPEESWGHLINLGASVIQTDRPEALIDYLSQINKRDLN